ncbi:protein PML [Anomalospiza imberbis]|uniref:protein PML n=1 Tax=Anomalospiza imberbis TaxID=187417 RepID=UPI00358EC3E5
METEPEAEAAAELLAEPCPAASTPVPASPPRHPAEGEGEDEDDDDFQFLHCDGCGQDSARPRLLRCLHTLCPACLSDTKQCPRCQAATAAPAVDNLLFCNLRSRLQLWRQIRSAGGPGCGRCRAEAALVWCEECEEFLCGRCLEEHQWWHKKKAHRVRRVEELRAGSARQFLEDTRSSCSLFCSSGSHPEESRVCSIYCPRCERALCCPCALLDTGHAPFRDLRAESRRRQDELHSLRRDLRRLRRAFEAAAVRLRGETARREEQREQLRERVRASAERLQELVRSEAEELRALLEARPERGRSALAEELRGAEGTLLRLEAAERLVERLGRYGGEQELMDMQPFVKGALLELRRLRPPQPPELREPPDITECRVRLRALVERVTGRPDVPEVEVTLENNLVRHRGAPAPSQTHTHPNPLVPQFPHSRGCSRPSTGIQIHPNSPLFPQEDPKPNSVSPGLEEIHVEQPVPLCCWTTRPLSGVERGSQVSPKILKLECDHEPGPSHPKSQWEFQTEPGPSTAPHNCARAGDAEGGSIIICSSDDSDEDTVVVTVTPEPC